MLGIKDKKLFWYLVGLITSDGCLSKDGRHIIITSKDKTYLTELMRLIGLNCKIPSKRRGNDAYQQGTYYVLQFSDVAFYGFLKKIGLMSNKSLVIARLKIPRSQFCHFLRGLIDGDGCIRSWIHPSNGCEQWSLTIYSASVDFLSWLSSEIFILYHAVGKIHESTRSVKILKFGKLAAKKILKECYADNEFCLRRKGMLARQCLESDVCWKKYAGML